MRESQIKRLIKMLEESQIEELEVSRWGKKVRISKKARPAVAAENETVVAAGAAASDRAGESGRAPQAESEVPAADRLAITSPMVGTFYRASSPETEPFVKVGQRIEKGQVVCIVEAMKLMNEIQAEQGGKVVRILVENAQPVEYNQMLIVIDPEA